MEVLTILVQVLILVVEVMVVGVMTGPNVMVVLDTVVNPNATVGTDAQRYTPGTQP